MSIPIVEIFELIYYVGSETRSFEEDSRVLNANHIILCGCYSKTQNKEKYFALCLKTSDLDSYPHEINIEFTFKNNTKTITAHCSCQNGNSGRCKHIVGTLLYLNR